MNLEKNCVYLPVFVDSGDQHDLVGFFGLSPDLIEPLDENIISGPESPITMRMTPKEGIAGSPSSVFVRGAFFKKHSAKAFSDRFFAELSNDMAWQAQEFMGEIKVIPPQRADTYQAFIGFHDYAAHIRDTYRHRGPNGRADFENIIGSLLEEMGKCQFTEKVFWHNKALMVFESGVKTAFEVGEDAPKTEKKHPMLSDLYDSVQQAVNEVRAVTKDSEKKILIYFKSGDIKRFNENEILIITDAWPFLPSFYPPQVKHLINHSSIERVEVANLDEALKKTEARHASRQK